MADLHDLLSEYPEDHSPFCYKDCTHPCHDKYDEEHSKDRNGT